MTTIGSLRGIAEQIWFYFKDVVGTFKPVDPFSIGGICCFFLISIFGTYFGFTYDYSGARVTSQKSRLLEVKHFLLHLPIFGKEMLQTLQVAFVLITVFSVYNYFQIPAANAFAFGDFMLERYLKLFQFSPEHAAPRNLGFGLDLFYAVLVYSFSELGHWICHRLQHKIPFLWEFHKVHHSATLMTPATCYRLHPIDSTLLNLCEGVFLALAALIFSVCVGNRSWGDDNLIVQLVFMMMWVPTSLHHSLRWWSWGRLEFFFQSPATHLLHHSRDPADYNTNFGERLAIWDTLFGTLKRTEKYPPQEGLKLGLQDDLDQYAQASIGKLLYRPLVNSFTKGIFRKGNKN